MLIFYCSNLSTTQATIVNVPSASDINIK